MRVLVLLALVGAAVAFPKTSQRIVGGEATTVEKYPFMSNMQLSWFGNFWYQACGGSLLTTRTVISAAHCYRRDLPEDWRVRLGTSQPESGGTVHYIQSIVMHEEFNYESYDNDVAILWLSTAAVLGPSVATVRIAGPNYILADNTVVTTIGWGTLWAGGPSPTVLQEVDINIINQELCTDRYFRLQQQPGYGRWPLVTDRMLCAGILDVGGKDACQGDSGGPLVHDLDVLVGIVSWGQGCADSYYPGVNVRVSEFTDWIVANAS